MTRPPKQGRDHLQVEDPCVGCDLAEGEAGVDREGDQVGALHQFVLFQGLDDFPGCKVLAVEVRE